MESDFQFRLLRVRAATWKQLGKWRREESLSRKCSVQMESGHIMSNEIKKKKILTKSNNRKRNSTGR
ncbi:hypothetical protein SNEBB_003815 [Seison nebaliae]|nr:hypothetical protein SNEBB_003815 [Seison nebaliae]